MDAVVLAQNTTDRPLSIAPIAYGSDKSRKRRRARRRPRKRTSRPAPEPANNTTGSWRRGLLDLPDEILAGIVWWALSSPEPTDLIKAVASWRGCCTRLDALCRMPLFRTADVGPRFAPFARCDADGYDPSVVPGDGHLVSAAGLARAPRLRRSFVQTCVRYAIYSLIVTKPGTFVSNHGLELVSFSSFMRQRPPFSLMVHALTRGTYAPDHIETCEYDDGCTTVRIDYRVAATALNDGMPGDLDEHTQSMINGALVAAAAEAMSTTASRPDERSIVIHSIDLFEAYPDMIKGICSTRPGFSCHAGHARHLTRQASLDVSSIVYPECWDAVCDHARRSQKPLTDFSFLCDE